MRKNSDFALIIIVACLAIALRLAYLSVTTYEERGHDVFGHVDYINYLVDHHALPNRDDGWQFYQPPLYYVAGALIVAGAETIGYDRESGFVLVQLLSFILSIIVFVICIGCAYHLFPHKENRPDRTLFLLFLAAIPSYVFFSARLNNDVFAQVTAFASVLLLLQWWKKPELRTWIILSVTIGLGLLSKMNMVLFLPIAGIVALAQSGIRWSQKIVMVAILGIASLIIAGWYVIPPFLEEDQARSAVIGNADHMTGPIPNTWNRLLVFNPVEVLRHPFNQIDGEGARRHYLWEYLFRSMFFGEFSYHSAATSPALIMLFTGILALIAAACSLIIDLLKSFKSPTFPLAVATIVLMAGALAVRIAMPFSSSQDFRYSTALLIPFAYYALMSGSGHSQMFRRITMGLLSIASVIFLLILFFTDGR
jgi:4-amino-4-deoxy-L-arabinose transferase-like glycosyltransferase